MTMVHQEIDAVLFGVMGYGSDSGTLEYLGADVHFEAAGCPRFGADLSAQSATIPGSGA
jgi:hypothetical protein